MANSIEFAKNYTGILDEVYQRAAVSRCLNSGGRMVRAGRNAKEILIPKISVTGLGDYTRNVGYKTGSITYEYETHSFGYDRAIRLFADVMDVEESGVLDCFVEAGAELQRTQVAPEGDAYTFSQIASTEGVTVKGEDLSEASAVDVLAALRAVTNDMDENQVSTGSRYLFITPTLRGVLDDFSLANPTRSNRVLERFSRIVEVPQVRFYTAIDLPSRGVNWVGDEDARLVWGRWNADRTAKVHSFGQVTFSECDDPAKLLALTRKALVDAVQPKVSYEIDVAALDGGECGLGDEVAVVDSSRTPEWRLKARVVKRVRTFGDAVVCRVTIGTVQQVDYAVTSSLAADVAALQNDVAGIDGNLSVATSVQVVESTVTEAIDDLDELADLDF